MELFKGRFAGDFSYNLLDFYWIIQLLGVFFFFLNFLWFYPTACGILIPQPGIDPTLTVLRSG